jgi:lysophospholipase L1-like esterase
VRAALPRTTVDPLVGPVYAARVDTTGAPATGEGGGEKPVGPSDPGSGRSAAAPEPSGGPRANDRTPVRWQVRLLAVVVVIGLPLAVDWIAGFVTYHVGDYREKNLGNFRTNVDKTGFRRQDPNYHHGLAAKRSITETWGKVAYTVATNSLGFKDATTRDVPLQSDEPRLLFIGDSFTEGLGIPYEQTWVGLIGKELSRSGITVLNAGVSSYCPKTVYYKVKTWLDSGLRLSRIVFFIDVSDMADELIFNDFVPANKDPDDSWTGRYIKTPSPPTFTQYSLIYRTLLKRWGRDPWKNTIFTEPNTGERFVFDPKERETWTRGPMCAWVPAGERSAAYYVTKLAALCAAHNIAFEIAIYPWPEEIAANDTHSRYRTFWQSFAAEQHISCYDLHDVFFPADPAARQQLLTQDFITGDVHWSEPGHQLVAREWLRQYAQRHPGS